MQEIVNWLVKVIGSLGYPGIVALMFLESSFFPFPSEVVIPPAGYLASQGEMKLTLVIIMGIAGSLLGAFFNYYFAIFLGRPAILKAGKYVGISEAKLASVERFFRAHGEITTFTCRLIPGIRQVISFPAGLARMNILKFTVYTGLGAGIWVTVLALTGYWVGHNMELVEEYMKRASVWALIFVALLTIGYIWYHLKFRRFRIEKKNMDS